MPDHTPDGADSLGFPGIGPWLDAPGPGRGREEIPARAIAVAHAAELLELRSLWVTEPSGGDPEGPPYEAYSLLGALAVRTAQLRLGVGTRALERRAPSILAKIVTGVDVISHGRAVLALGADGSDPGDGGRLSEALTVCRLVLEDELPTFTGRCYSIDAAVNRPAPVQPGGVPIVVFIHGDGPGRRALIEAAVGSADAIVVDGGADGVRQAVAMVDERRDQVPTRTVEVLGQVAGDAPVETVASQIAGIRDAMASGCLVGLPYPWEPSALEAAALAW